jgi:hypothetical protein
MAGNFQGDLSGNILVEFDYNNIVLVDPNKTSDSQGVIRERLVDQENLVMFANLEAQVLPRTKLALGTQPGQNVSTSMTIAGINFLKPTKDNYMTTGYYDELTGKNSLVGRAQNQMSEQRKVDSKNNAYFTRGVVDSQSIVDNGLLGITQISIKTSTSFIPSVSMQLEDVQGRALFQLGDQSPYAAFFNLPYPQFYLTIKGFYGQAIRYQLNLEKFDARFNSSSGNYSITLEFKGFKFNILNEILVSHLIAVPHMYNKRFSVLSEIAQANTSTNERSLQKDASGGQTGKITNAQGASVSPVTEYVTERGYEKVVEVYNEYKTKGLIPSDFPELTLMQFVYKMDMFEQNAINSYPKANVEPLTDIKNYQKTLSNFFEGVRGSNTNSWFSINMDPRPIVLDNGTLVYYFKENIRQNPQAKQLALDQLKNLVNSAVKTLKENPTLGEGRKLEIKLNNLNYDSFFFNLNLSDINENATAARYFNLIQVTDPTLITRTNEEIKRLFITNQTINGVNFPNFNFFVFEGVDKFDNIVKTINAEASQKLAQIQEAITADLAAFIQDSATGIGFKPTVRNIAAVIMANAEAFIRLMEDVHTNSWNQRNNPVRKVVIQDTSKSAPNPEAPYKIPITQQAANQNQGITTGEEPVYPWPQFFIESPDDKKGRFQLEYLGHPSVVKLTQAYNYKIWPEVEFVEEYIKGLSQKDNLPISQPPQDSQLTTFLTQINAIEFPPSNLPYFNKQEIRFFYEIWERQYITSFYSNYIRVNSNQRNQLITTNFTSEAQNILLSLGTSNPFLTFNLKNKPLTSLTYPVYLREISNNGTGTLWVNFESGIFNTPYIKEEVDNPFAIYKTTQLGLNPETHIPLKALEQIVLGASNEPLIIDTYPFTSPSWVKDNMSLSNQSEGNQVYNSNKSLKVYADRNVISNFTNLFNYTENRPVTNFCFYDAVQPTLVTAKLGTETAEIKDFYEKEIPSKFIPTVGYVWNPLANKINLPVRQTTSILNTPYFINAMINGVTNEKNRREYPYIQAAYLFLNSLPLGTLRERYKSLGQKDELDYVASCFNKFGALHKIPYAWILKIGSIWYRYKNFIENQKDILDDTVWTNFNYLKSYDPNTQSPTKVYQYRKNSGTAVETKIVLQSTQNNDININTGFYPGLMNDFSYFFNGVNLFKNYTDEELQSAVNDKLQLFNFPSSSINAKENGKNLTLTTWSVLLPTTLKDSYSILNECLLPPTNNQNTSTYQKYYIMPSFGINVNQTKSQCLSNPTSPQETIEPIVNNKSMYNGSVRTLWSAPNYGYFNSDVLRKPTPEEYMNTILPTASNQSPMTLQSEISYSKIEEIFGVFDRKSLNIMEKEFLEFCKPASAVKYQKAKSGTGAFIIDIDVNYRNFQLFFKNSMVVETNLSPSNGVQFYNNAIETQFQNFKNNIRNLMEYDVLIKNGNPSKYNRRVFNSFLQTPNFARPIVFKPYESDSLPTNGGTTTLLQSETKYPREWQALRAEVGFSTIPGLVYSSNGSYITDFFVDNNIEFSVNNISILGQLIKIYATQKLTNPSLNSSTFKSTLQTFLGTERELQNELLGQVIDNVKKGIKDVPQPIEQNIQSQLSGTQGKAELYSLFRALNDKWIAGTDYVSKTLFEDFLFLDRASRNIGDTILVDIFAVKNLINKNALNEQMSVYTLLSGLLMQNNFTVMPLPAYVNYYNVLNTDGTKTPNSESIQNFGNNLWGTFTTVDYRNATPKMVCFYVGKPSDQLPLPRQISGFGDDGFDLRNPNNPLIENQQDKTDWEYSNKVVGFTVDIGIRNQNVFKNFSVSQDTGKATSEAIAALIQMTDQTNTRNVATQNASLYNLYKRRSYQCDLECLGNALIQPTMYFNLRHVPMFYGPYMITEVTHNITPGDFVTNFKGVRQGYFDFPQIDSFIQKINQNLLTKIEALIFQKTDQKAVPTSQQAIENNLIVNTNTIEAAAEKACFDRRAPQFLNYITQPIVPIEYPRQSLVDDIKRKFPTNQALQTVVYILSYVRSYSTPGKNGGNFVAANYNFADITLDKPLPGDVIKNIESGVYSCKKVKTADGQDSSLPAARFASVDKYLDFMGSLLTSRVPQIVQGFLIQYYCTEFPSSGISLQYYQQNQQRLEERFKPIFIQAVDSAKDSGFTISFDLNPPSSTGTTNNLNTTTNLPLCPTTTITSLTPSDGKPNKIITLEGTYLEYVRVIEMGGVPSNLWTRINPSTVELISSNKIKFSVPTIPSITTPTSLNVRVITTTSGPSGILAPVTFDFYPS